MTVQDAYATTNNWLEIMLKYFDNNNVVAVVGQQVTPHDKDKNPHQWYRPVSKARVIEMYFKESKDFLKLSGNRKSH